MGISVHSKCHAATPPTQVLLIDESGGVWLSLPQDGAALQQDLGSNPSALRCLTGTEQTAKWRANI